MAQQLDTTAASELISNLDSHFADLRRHLMPPYQPTGRRSWSSSGQTLDVDGFQKIADEMRLYLGLTRAVRVRLLTDAFDHDDAGTGLGGMQWSEDPWRSDIALSCRSHMQTANLAAVLAHEMTHAFLQYKGFHGESEEHNELLTEAGAIYLGMGKLLRDGYAPISWKEPGPPGIPFVGEWITTHTKSVGYVDVASVKLLMDLSSQCSGCHYGSHYRHANRMFSMRNVRPGERRAPWLFQRWADQRSRARNEETTRIARNIDDLEHLYDNLDATFTSQSFLGKASGLVGPEWSEVGRAYALYASAGLKSELTGINIRMSHLKSGARWDMREAKMLDTDVAKEAKLLRNVLARLDKQDRKNP